LTVRLAMVRRPVWRKAFLADLVIGMGEYYHKRLNNQAF